MALCHPTSRRSKPTRGKSPWTAPHTLPCERRIPSSHCPRSSRARTSNCVTGITTTFCPRIITSQGESSAPTGSRQSAPRSVCAHFSFRSRAASPVSMNENKTLLPLVAIIGPTASGKSALAVKLAERLGGEVVACDSTQLYRGFDIGTAKPTLAERHGIPHHLIDVLGPKDDATAGGYRQLALQILEALRQRKPLPG